jgi:thioredoxin-related protein
VQKAENCTFCNTVKQEEKAKTKKEETVQQILPRDLYLKYQLVESQKPIKLKPQWLPPHGTPEIIQTKDSLRIK